jgi:hypothetical protein
MMTSSQKESNYGIKDRLLIRSFWGEFAVISRPHIQAQMPVDKERNEMRNRLLEEGEHLVDFFDLDFKIDRFKTYYKNVWKYFSSYIGFFDMDRKDVRFVNILNDVQTLLLYESTLEDCEIQTCVLFIKGLLYTISTYDIKIYRDGFYSKGVLYIPLPHQGGGSDFIEITIDQFDKEFLEFCEQYWKYGRF